MRRAYSLSFLTCLDAPPPDAIRTAAECGYDYVGLRLSPAMPGGIAYALMDEPELMRDTTAALRDTGLKVFDIEMIRIGPDFKPQSCLPLIETGARLGARAILIAGDDEDEARLTASFASLCETMAPYPLSADLEFMPQSKVRDARAAVRIINAAHQPNAAIIVDALHVSRSRTSLHDIASIPRSRLNYAQICDGPAEIPDGIGELNRVARHERLLPGDGAIDLIGLFATLPPDLPVAVEIPNDKQAPVMGAREWARQALLKTKRVIAAAQARSSAEAP